MSFAELLLFQIINLYKVVYTTATVYYTISTILFIVHIVKNKSFTWKKKKLVSDKLLGNHLLIIADDEAQLKRIL